MYIDLQSYCVENIHKYYYVEFKQIINYLFYLFI